MRCCFTIEYSKFAGLHFGTVADLVIRIAFHCSYVHFFWCLEACSYFFFLMEVNLCSNLCRIGKEHTHKARSKTVLAALYSLSILASSTIRRMATGGDQSLTHFRSRPTVQNGLADSASIAAPEVDHSAEAPQAYFLAEGLQVSVQTTAETVLLTQY